MLAAEKEERALGTQVKAGYLRALEASLRDETLIREEFVRRTAQGSLGIVERLQAERASREGADERLG